MGEEQEKQSNTGPQSVPESAPDMAPPAEGTTSVDEGTTVADVSADEVATDDVVEGVPEAPTDEA